MGINLNGPQANAAIAAGVAADLHRVEALLRALQKQAEVALNGNRVEARECLEAVEATTSLLQPHLAHIRQTVEAVAVFYDRKALGLEPDLEPGQAPDPAPDLVAA